MSLNKAHPANPSFLSFRGKDAVAGLELFSLSLCILMAICAFFYFRYNIGFELGTHNDEPKKVRFVLNGMQDFAHPVLMLQLVRAANFFYAYTEPQDVVVLGRSIAALLAAITVVLTYILARTSLQRLESLCAAAIVAVVPLTVIHARHFKEDMYLAPLILLAAILTVRFVDKPTRRNAMMLGVATGLAVAAKYVAIVLLPMMLVLPYLNLRVDRVEYQRHWAVFLMSGVAIFLLVNFPAFYDPSRFVGGVSSEFNHATAGHSTQLFPWLTLFVYHLSHSLAPGMGWPIVLLAIAGGGLIVWHWRGLDNGIRICLIFAAVWYLVHEISPLKLSPRYMVPIAPFIAILAVFCVKWLLSSAGLRGSALGGALVALLVLAAANPAYIAAATVRDAMTDTRDVSAEILGRLSSPATLDRYATFKHQPLAVGKAHLDGVDNEVTAFESLVTRSHYFATADLSYSRYFIAQDMPFQKQRVYWGAELYKKLFALPRLEISYRHGPFSFHNPIVQIIDLRTGGDELKSIADASKWPPHISVRYFPRTTE